MRKPAEWVRTLCRDLCRNPAIPARVGPFLVVSLKHTPKAANMLETPMNTASLYHPVSLGFLPYQATRRFDTEEVAGSNPVVPTIYFQWFSRSRSPLTSLFQPKIQPKLASFGCRSDVNCFQKLLLRSQLRGIDTVHVESGRRWLGMPECALDYRQVHVVGSEERRQRVPQIVPSEAAVVPHRNDAGLDRGRAKVFIFCSSFLFFAPPFGAELVLVYAALWASGTRFSGCDAGARRPGLATSS